MKMQNLQKGFGLLELMISLTIGLFLLGGVYAIYEASANSYHKERAMMQLQQDAYLAARILKEAVLSDTYSNCTQISPYLKIVKEQDFIGVNEFEAIASNKELPSNLDLHKNGSGKIKSGSDVLIVRKISQDDVIYPNGISFDTNTLKVPKDYTLSKSDKLIITDCRHIELDQITKVSNNRTSKKATLAVSTAFKFDDDTFVGKYKLQAFYIGNTTRHDSLNQAIYGLYVKDTKGYRHELIEGVEGFSIKLVLQDGNLISPNDVTNWQEVKGFEFVVKVKPVDTRKVTDFKFFVALRNRIS